MKLSDLPPGVGVMDEHINPRDLCGCGQGATECIEGVLFCTTCYDVELQCRDDAAADAHHLEAELTVGRWPK